MAKWIKNETVRKEEWRPGGEELDYGQGMYGKQPPPVSIEDRTVVGTTDQGLNSTNRMPGVGGSRNR